MNVRANAMTTALFVSTWLGSLLLVGPASGQDLPRRGFLGAGVGSAEAGVRVVQVFPDSPAARAGLEVDDLIRSIDGTGVESPPAFVRVVQQARAGQDLRLVLDRDGHERDVNVTLVESPRETIATGEIRYEAVASRGELLRTLVTKPPGDGPFPAVLIIQGLGNFSIDNPAGTLSAYKRIVDDLTASGFVTMRVDKPGCGDSQGGPFGEITVLREADGYLQGLRALKDYDFVDEQNCFLFGHSMGGFIGPYVAAQEPVRGLAVYGTGIKTWYEYLLENFRRQSALAGIPAPQIDDAMRLQTRFWYALLIEKRTPGQIVDASPDLEPLLRGVMPDGEHMQGAKYIFFQELADQNFAALWATIDADVLALWGAGDYVSTREDHALIAETVQEARGADRAEFRVLDGIDHFFKAADSFEASRQGFAQNPFNPIIITTLRDWFRDHTRPLDGADRKE